MLGLSFGGALGFGLGFTGLVFFSPDPARNVVQNSTGNVLRLRDGRRLGYKEYGATNSSARTVFYLHGTGSSRLEVESFDWDAEHAKKSGIRVISIDRPATGMSDDLKNRTLSDFAHDVLEVADKLNINEFAVAGYAGGGSYALACAHELPKIAPGRLQRVALVSADGSQATPKLPKSLQEANLPSFVTFSLKHAPILMEGLMRLGRFSFFRNRSHFSEGAEQAYLSCPLDLHVLSGLDKEKLADNQTEGFRQGVAGFLRDMQLTKAQPLPFKLKEVNDVPVDIWHGDRDPITPVAWARLFARRIPTANLHIASGHGHLSTAYSYWPEILGDLTKQGARNNTPAVPANT